MASRAYLPDRPLTRATASLVPHFDVTVHIVLDDFGKAGRVYRETDEEDTTAANIAMGSPLVARAPLLPRQRPFRCIALSDALGEQRTFFFSLAPIYEMSS